jgi:alkanesulfonate monooxygenase SsuD/methylene tetrahydromethanopterin reductase-like flavin-dependent oxidoreductase (luciferase family)
VPFTADAAWLAEKRIRRNGIATAARSPGSGQHILRTYRSCADRIELDEVSGRLGAMGEVSTPRTGIVLRPQLAPHELKAASVAVDRSGVDELWLWEDCFLEAGVSAAALSLGATEHVEVGVGLFPAPLRNAALMAMELATLAGAFPGRLSAGFGHGVQAWMAQVGAQVDSPLTLLSEYVAAIRSLLGGETVSSGGRYVRLGDVRLDWPPAVAPPLLIGGRGPRTIALAAAIADGVILDAAMPAPDVTAACSACHDQAPAGFRIVVYREPRSPMRSPALAAELAELLAEARAQGASSVVLQPPGDAPDPRPLIDALPV